MGSRPVLQDQWLVNLSSILLAPGSISTAATFSVEESMCDICKENDAGSSLFLI